MEQWVIVEIIIKFIEKYQKQNECCNTKNKTKCQLRVGTCKHQVGTSVNTTYLQIINNMKRLQTMNISLYL